MSIPLPRRSRRQSPDVAIKHARALLAQLGCLDAIQRSDLLRIDAPGFPLPTQDRLLPLQRGGGATRWHALQDEMLLVENLRAFLNDTEAQRSENASNASPAATVLEPADLVDPTEAFDGARAMLAHQAMIASYVAETQQSMAAQQTRSARRAAEAEQAMAARMGAICALAGLTNSAAQRAASAWVDHVAAYLRGVDDRLVGKPLWRHLSATRTTARRLSVSMTRLPHDPRSAKLLPLLDSLQANAARMLAELEMPPPGRAEVPDPVPYGAEGVLAIWLHHHTHPPTYGRNRASFIWFGETLLGFAVKELGESKPDWIKRTTLATAIRQQVCLYHAEQRSAV